MDFSQHFAPLAKALEILENGQKIVQETMLTYMKVEAIKLSKKHSDDYVVLSGGNGSVGIDIYPGPASAERLEGLLATGDPHDEDEAYEWQSMVYGLNDQSSSTRFPPFVANDEIDEGYGVSTWNIGVLSFRNGALISNAEAAQYVESLPRHLKNFGEGN